jgi:UDP-glucuronate 4-epimerase
MAISKFIRAAQSGERISLFGDGSSQRDYTHVSDAVSAVLAVIDAPQPCAVFNVGGGSPIPLQGLVSAIEAAVGRSMNVQHVETQPGDVSLTWADPSLIRSTVGWQSQVGLVDGIRTMLDD